MIESLPWTRIIRPDVDELYTALRVDADHPYNFFWGIDLKLRRLLILKHRSSKSGSRQLPQLKEIEVQIFHTDDGFDYLIWALEDVSHETLFHELCLDVTKAAFDSQSEDDAIRMSLERTKQWQKMMRPISVLSRESQMGLIGELLILDRFLLNSVPAEIAVRSWVGPFGAPRDFDLGLLNIESKTRSSGMSHEVMISSELQLDLSPEINLILCVNELVEATDHTDGYSVSELAASIRNKINPSESLALELFDERIEAVGLTNKDDYSKQKWLDCGTELFQVSGLFPKLVSREIPNAISKVRYSIDLDFCQNFLINESQLKDFVGGS